MDNDFYQARRKKLEADLITAALELVSFTRSAAVVIPVPDTDPCLYVAVGEADDITASLPPCAIPPSQ